MWLHQGLKNRGLWLSWWGNRHHAEEPVQFSLLSGKGTFKPLQDGSDQAKLWDDILGCRRGCWKLVELLKSG